MGRFFGALVWIAGFVIPAAAAFYGGYAVTGNVFRQRAIPLPFEHFGFAAGAAAACFALGAVCLVRYLFRLLLNQRS